MSWSVSASKVPADKVLETIEAFVLGEGYSSDFARDEAETQLVAAKISAKLLFHTGTVGTTGEFNINLNGHAEPNHVKRPGYSQSYVRVSLEKWHDYTNG